MILTTLIVSTLLAPDAVSVKPKVIGASMFKNGYAIITREIPLNSHGEASIVEIPQSSLGTLWFSASKGTMIEEIRNTEQATSYESSASSFEELLRMNVGKPVTITTVNLGILVGKIAAVQGDILMLESGETTSMIQRGEIRRIELANGVTKQVGSSTQRVLKLTAKGPGPLYMVSLERGMTWAPGYAVELKDDKNLTITGKATVLDDLADLDNVETRFITGFPNVPFAGLPDPLVSGQSIDQFVGLIGGFGLQPQGLNNFRNNRGAEMMAQGAAAPVRDFGDGMQIQSLPGMQAEELFFYRRPSVTLKRGDRAYYVLFRAETTYERLYTWDIDDPIENDVYRPSPGGEAAPEDVWQTLKFKNTAGQPLTTAAASTFRDGQIVGQDMLRYTSPGAEAKLRVTKAMDVHAARSEEEVTRQKGALIIPNIGPFDLVTLKGTIAVQNLKADAINIQIRKDLTGEVISSDGSPKVTKTAKGLKQNNPRSVLEWTVPVASGKSISLTYSYKVYIRTY